jgi:acetolactate synthase-1/2/3 large subunit
VPATSARIGGGVVVESLEALGAQVAFGVPGIHALAIWDGLRTSPIRVIGTRTELSAAFAADGYARTTGRPAPLLLSTGPGALNSLTGLMEAASAHVPVLAISSQIPRAMLGRSRGYLHELPDQLASFAPVVKHAARADSIEAIPERLAEAWRIALTPPSGPVYVEIPVDLLREEASIPPIGSLDGEPTAPSVDPGPVAEAVALLMAAKRPLIWGGAGVVRSGAEGQLRTLAERLRAPVATTYMGKAGFDDAHPLAVGSGCDEAAFQELVAGADLVLCVGTELGAETTDQYRLKFSGQVIQIDADPRRFGASYEALALLGDAKLTLAAILAALDGAIGGAREESEVVAEVAGVRARIREGLAAQGRELELGLLKAIEAALPPDAITCWDMTILAYWAAPHLRLRSGQQFHYPLGSGTLGYSWPAALGAKVAAPERAVLSVAGDGGFQYALAELGTAAQHRIAAKLLLVHDGGYGILREYQRSAYGETGFVDLGQPDFVALAGAFGVPVRSGGPDDLTDDLAWALAQDGPAVVIVRTLLTAAQPTP